MEPDLDSALRNLLEEERRRVGGAGEERKGELRALISDRESELESDSLLQAFKNHIAVLPDDTRPRSELEQYRIFPEWEDGLKQELAGWKAELDKLESEAPNGRLIYNNARERVLQALDSVAQEAGLLQPAPPRREVPESKPVAEMSSLVPSNMSGWMSLAQLGEWGFTKSAGDSPVKPSRFREPQGQETSVNNWADLFFTVAKWLVEKEILVGPFSFKTMTKRYLIHSEPSHPNGRKFGWSRELPNGLFLECQWGAKDSARLSGQLLAEFGQDPAEFHVYLS